MTGKITFFESDDILAQWEEVEGKFIGHIVVSKWNKDIKALVINILLDFLNSVSPVIYAGVIDEKHRKFLDSIGFLPTDGYAVVDGETLELYECRDWRNQ